MEAEADVRSYLEDGDASPEEIDDFMDWCVTLCFGGVGGAGGRNRRFRIYRLWAKLLRHRRAPYRRNTIFDFNIVLKKYIRSIVEDDIVDAAAPRGAIMPDNRTFVKYVVRRLDHAL